MKQCLAEKVRVFEDKLFTLEEVTKKKNESFHFMQLQSTPVESPLADKHQGILLIFFYACESGKNGRINYFRI